MAFWDHTEGLELLGGSCVVSWVDSGAFGCTRCTFQRLQYGLRCRLKRVWLHQVNVLASSGLLRTVLAAPGGRFRTQGGGKQGGSFQVGADPPVGTLWAPFLPLLEPYSETLLGNDTSVTLTKFRHT